MPKKRVAVIGLGAIGAQVLWQLSKLHDVDASGFETYTPGHGYGASGGDGRFFRTVQYRDRRYVPLLSRANEIWEDLQADSQRELRVITGGFVVGPSDHEEIREALDGIAEYGLDCTTLEAKELRERFPLHAFDDSDLGIIDPKAGVIRPELSNITALDQATSLGALVHSRSRITALNTRGAQIEVVVDGSESHIFDHVVVATGAWATKLLPGLSQHITPKKLVSAWYFARDNESLKDFPAFVRTAPVHCYAVPSQDGLSLKLGLSSALHEPVENPDSSDYLVRDRNLRHFDELQRAYFPGLHPDPFRVETYFEGYTKDSRPIVQRLNENLTIMAGFSGHGFKLAPVFGEIGAALACGQPIDPDIEFLQRDDLEV